MNLSTFGTFKVLDDSENLKELSERELLTLKYRLLEMLVDIDTICRENGLEYQLGGGSCLGAVRHSGFIPWDDDADVNMPRDAYARFAQVVRRDWSGKYWLHDPGSNRGDGLCFARLRMKGTILRSRDDLDPGDDQCGIYVDIFFIDGAPDSPVVRRLHGLGSLLLGFALSCRKFHAFKDFYLGLAGKDRQVRRVFRVKAALGAPLTFMQVGTWCRMWDRWNAMFSRRPTKMVTVPVGRRHYFGELIPRTSILPSSEREFEGHSLKCPRDCDRYLKQLYGQYMVIPDESEREKHVVLEFNPGDDGDHK